MLECLPRGMNAPKSQLSKPYVFWENYLWSVSVKVLPLAANPWPFIPIKAIFFVLLWLFTSKSGPLISMTSWIKRHRSHIASMLLTGSRRVEGVEAWDSGFWIIGLLLAASVNFTSFGAILAEIWDWPLQIHYNGVSPSFLTSFILHCKWTASCGAHKTRTEFKPP